MELELFLKELLSLEIAKVQEEVVKLTSWLDERNKKTKVASETAYVAQTDLRAWLLKYHICDETEVDSLIPRLRSSGVKDVAALTDFTKDDLKECGFNTFQAIAMVKALKK